MVTIQTRKGKKGVSYRVEFMRDRKRVSKSFKLKKDAQKFVANITVYESFVYPLTNHTLTTWKFSDAVKQFIDQDNGKDTSKI